MSREFDVNTYYRQITEVDIGEIARELLTGRIVGETPRTLFCDCPNHQSQSRRSLNIMLDKQGWYCFGCRVGGDVLQLVEFVRFGQVTRGQSGPMPESHRQARDFLAARVGLPPLAQLSSMSPEEAEAEHRLTLRVREALTALAEIYHERLVRNGEVLSWFRAKYGIGDEMIARLKIGYADDNSPSAARLLMEGSAAFTSRELTATSAFQPTAQDCIVPFFDRRIVFPYWSRGHVVFLIGRRTPWTPEHDWEKAKYKKLAVRNDRNHSHVAACVRNDVLYNEDVLLTRPERVVITEGVTDCISLMEHGFAAVSPVTVRIREADWGRIIAKLAGVQTVYICQDNEISEAGMQGALKTARALARHGIQTRVAVLPLGEKQIAARAKLSELPENSPEVDTLRADAKIDVNEFFASGKTAADFEDILAAAQTPLEMAIAQLDANTPDEQLESLLAPILAEVACMAPIERERHLRLIQARGGKAKLPVSILRQQMKVVALDGRARDNHARKKAPTGVGGDHGKESLPKIQVNNRQLREIVSEAWGAIHHANQHGCEIYHYTPFLFHRAGRLVRLVVGEFGPEIEEMDEDAVFGLLARTADWHRATEEAGVETSPPRDVARDILAFPDLHLPVLEGVIRTPVFGRQGKLILDEGYHPDDRLWLARDSSLDLGAVAEVPAAEHVAAARDLLLNDLLIDFPFVDASDRAHAVAVLILPFVRRMVDGPTPMHLIEAPTMGSGKGLLANLISITATGAACEARTLPESEDEIRKMLTAELMKGRPIILLDNANDRRQLHSSALASVLTSVRWTDRKLGESTMASAPNHAVWLMTANNPNLHLELARRCIRIRIDPRVDRPWKRTSFKHPEIATWAQDNRAALVASVLTLIRAWMAAGKPLGRGRLGSFERWSAMLGGILEVAGIPGFLANLDELYEAADVEGQAWREFTSAWWEAFRTEPKKVSELNEFCEQRELMLRLRGDGSARSQQTRLGVALNRYRDRSFDGLRIVRARNDSKHKGANMYALRLIGDKQMGTCGDYGDVVGDLDEEGPHRLSNDNSTDYGLPGDLGDLYWVPSRIEKNLCMGVTEDILTHIRARACKVVGNKVPKVPKVPKVSVSACKESSKCMGTLESEVPIRSSSSLGVPNLPTRTRIDLADLTEWPEPPDGDLS